MSDAADLALAMGCVLAVWGGLFLLLAGLGRGLLRIAFGRTTPLPDLVGCTWLGFAGAIVALQLWHLWLPVDWRAVAALAALSALGWCSGQSGRLRAGSPRPPMTRPVLAGLTVLALWLADRAIGPGAGYDSASYHLTVVRWLDRFPIVPGLANLNPLYGLNLSGLLVPALLEQGPGTGRSSHFFNGFLVFLLLLQIANLAGRRPVTGEAPTAPQLFAAILLYPVVIFPHRGDGTWVSSLATDVPVAVVLFGASCLAIEAFSEDGERRTPGLDSRLFSALALIAVSPCLKSTALVFAAAAWLTLAVLWARRQGSCSAWRSGSFVVAVLFAAAAVVPWLARGMLLSGYPLYPASFAGLDLDWRLPIEHAQGHLWWARAYTRTPDAWDLMLNQEGTSWLPYWMRTELRPALHEVLVPVALIALWTALRLAGLGGRADRRVPPLLIPLLVAIPVWFLSAPAVRYGLSLFWLLCAQLGALVLAPALASLPRRRLAYNALLLFSTSTPLALHGYYAVKYRGEDTTSAALAKVFWTPPGPDHGFHPLHRPALERLAACGGLAVFVPAARPGEAPWPDVLPWDAPLPATSLLLDGLCPRRPGNLGAGFRIEARGLSWAERNSAEVAAVRRRTGWSVGRLAVHFCVRPDLIEESLRLSATLRGSAAQRAFRASGLGGAQGD